MTGESVSEFELVPRRITQLHLALGILPRQHSHGQITCSLPGEGSTHLRDCRMTAVGTNAKCRLHRAMFGVGGKAENICSLGVFRILTPKQTRRLRRRAS